ncbi:alpha/beta fold hydrolase [Amycolatopsis cihanbeyliensis]|uniref:Pimeloyl-ACP methyl ester carboxylesterase n=1 Tax=Amycolatopsis cihanbeyliensis TaxID=1128664 RepID=A0A542CSI7_AMYCI|nr:alpha/beta hydrolase [Amycolatopsis cihanbeyliensis]TQI93789.1 pimeloyl-ACP methyl ester carboxylesterase [Amycolatopsis cihanbeyliensis]
MTRVHGERFRTVGELRLCYQTFGDPAEPACLLVMGLGYQLIAWPDEFCELLAARGLWVIRFDNRDSGRSTHLTGAPAPAPLAVLTGRARAPYRLADMAGDAVGLLGELGIERAHLVGVSMGGMIAQTVAAHHGSRVRSLVSMMSTTGSRRVGLPSPRVLPFLLGRPSAQPAAYVRQATRLNRVVRSPRFAADEPAVRDMLWRNLERGMSPDGFARQVAAVLASGDRTRALGRITAPTLVVHGAADRMISPSGGRATARAIAGADLLMVEGMGHDLPRELWPRLIDAITGNAVRAS